MEIGVVHPNERLEKLYREDIEKISKYMESGDTPDKEKLIEFDESVGKFSTNWEISYSPYLTHLYQFKDQAEYENLYKPKVDRWNRVLVRIAQEKKMTKKNEDVISEMKVHLNSGF